MNNRTLFFVFIGVLLVFFGARLLRKDHSASFDADLIKIDTTRVDLIKYAFAAPSDNFELRKENNSWNAVKGDASIEVKEETISNLFAALEALRANKVMTKDPSHYGEFEITDQLATRVTVYEGKKQVGALLLGGFRFDQVARSASAFVRKGDDPEVYEVDGFAAIALRQTYDQFRDPTILNIEPNDMTKLEWSNAAGRKEAISKEDGKWHYAGMEELDSTLINTYIQQLSNVRGSEFSDLTSVSDRSEAERLVIYGNNMIEPITIRAYPQIDTISKFLIRSSQNNDAIFLSDSSGIYKRIFGDLRQFWPNGQ